MYQNNYDVCIFGGGPAGAIAAKKLVTSGYRVILVEKDLELRYDHYFSLTPGTINWLRFLELTDGILERSYNRSFQTIRYWNKNERKKDLHDSRQLYFIYRSAINRAFLSQAIKEGAELFQPLTNYRVNQLPGGDWEIHLSNHESSIKINAAFLIEATGMQRVIRSKKKMTLPKSVAICGRFESSSFDHCILEAGPDFWLWGAPSPMNSYMLSFFSDPDVYKKYKTPERFMAYAMQECKLLPLANLKWPPALTYTCPATTYIDTNVISSRHIKIGDSAYCLDPIASQGIMKAINSAVHGAAVVNTLLSKTENANIAINYYQNMIRSGVQGHQQLIGNIYREQDIYTHSGFWRARQSIEKQELKNEYYINVQQNDLLKRNTEYREVETGVFQDNFIEPARGLQKSNEEPLVFINGIHVEKLVSCCQNRSLKECLITIAREFTHTDPASLLRWILFNKLIVPADH